jgi:hypothetical protein
LIRVSSVASSCSRSSRPVASVPFTSELPSCHAQDRAGVVRRAPWLPDIRHWHATEALSRPGRRSTTRRHVSRLCRSTPFLLGQGERKQENGKRFWIADRGTPSVADMGGHGRWRASVPLASGVYRAPCPRTDNQPLGLSHQECTGVCREQYTEPFGIIGRAGSRLGVPPEPEDAPTVVLRPRTNQELDDGDVSRGASITAPRMTRSLGRKRARIEFLFVVNAPSWLAFGSARTSASSRGCGGF